MVEPEADPERDQRTVFAYQVNGFPYFPYVSCLVYILLIIFVALYICTDAFEGHGERCLRILFKSGKGI